MKKLALVAFLVANSYQMTYNYFYECRQEKINLCDQDCQDSIQNTIEKIAEGEEKGEKCAYVLKKLEGYTDDKTIQWDEFYLQAMQDCYNEVTKELKGNAMEFYKEIRHCFYPNPLLDLIFGDHRYISQESFQYIKDSIKVNNGMEKDCIDKIHEEFDNQVDFFAEITPFCGNGSKVDESEACQFVDLFKYLEDEVHWSYHYRSMRYECQSLCLEAIKSQDLGDKASEFLEKFRDCQDKPPQKQENRDQYSKLLEGIFECSGDMLKECDNCHSSITEKCVQNDSIYQSDHCRLSRQISAQKNFDIVAVSDLNAIEKCYSQCNDVLKEKDSETYEKTKECYSGGQEQDKSSYGSIVQSGVIGLIFLIMFLFI